MQITEEQKQQLIDLNDSRVNQILNVLYDDTWYIFDSKSIQFNIKDGHGYGYSNTQGWNEKCEWLGCQDCNGLAKKATRQEVEQVLTNEAKRRGFENVGNLSFIFVDGRNLEKGFFETTNNKFDFCEEYNKLLLDGVEIFHNGQWAEIIDEKTELKEEIRDLENKLKELREKL